MDPRLLQKNMPCILKQCRFPGSILAQYEFWEWPITRMPLHSRQKHNVTMKLAFLGLFLFFCLIQKHNPYSSHFEKEEQAGEPLLNKSRIVIQLSLNWNVLPCSALIGTTGAQLAWPPNKLFLHCTCAGVGIWTAGDSKPPQRQSWSLKCQGSVLVHIGAQVKQRSGWRLP